MTFIQLIMLIIIQFTRLLKAILVRQITHVKRKHLRKKKKKFQKKEIPTLHTIPLESEMHHPYLKWFTTKPKFKNCTSTQDHI
jgi:hypothetical protein